MNKYQRDYEMDMQILSEAINNAPSKQDRRLLMSYRAQTFKYFVPRFYPQSKINPERRKGNLIGGLFYLTKEYPWPVDKDNNQYLQPIVQLDLEFAGELLNDYFGTGLLQVWGYDVEIHGHLRADHRVIPKSAMSNVDGTPYPSNIACAMHFNEKVISRPHVIWKSAAEMFMGTDEYVSLDWNADVVNVNSNDWVDEMEQVDNQFFSKNEPDFLDDSYFSDVIRSLSNVPYFGTYMGGYGGDFGSRGNFLKINPSKGRLLVRLSCDDDSNLGVMQRVFSLAAAVRRR